MEKLNYCNNLFQYERFKTIIVNIGKVKIGGNYPIALQSMTNTKNLDTKKTVEQIIKIAKNKADFVRLSIPSEKDAHHIKVIKQELKLKNISIPLVADIHFNPKLAEICARNLEKVRINPGNYVDSKRFKELKYTDKDYQKEIQKIEKKLLPLISICRENNTALRIGTNHGSLSDRIMSKYGDTPFGMVEATMEFLRICQEANFNQVVISLKSSNTKVMIYAYRLLVFQMKKENMNFPLHLGVTEAGEAEDGRIKSAIGIGTLLSDGIGDTIRVSLTENPELEIPVAKKIVDYFNNRENHDKIKSNKKIKINPFAYEKRLTKSIKNIGGENLAVVICDLNDEIINHKTLEKLNFKWQENSETWLKKSLSPEIIFVNNLNIDKNIILPKDLKILKKQAILRKKSFEDETEFFKIKNNKFDYVFLEISYLELNEELLIKINACKNLVLILRTNHKNGIAEQRAFFNQLKIWDCEIPVIIKRSYQENDFENLLLKSSIDIGALFIDGLGDGILIENQIMKNDFAKINELSFGILQASRIRMSKTEYISCPSCGRTLFDLQKTTKNIRKHTQNLKGLKIGIMGCMVNGLGEMADADYGYIGVGNDKINLYKNKILVKKNIPASEAVEELIKVIKNYGDWKTEI